MENVSKIIHQEVQAQLREQVDARVGALERRLLMLERQLMLSGAAHGNPVKSRRDCCDFTSASPFSGVDYPTYAAVPVDMESDLGKPVAATTTGSNLQEAGSSMPLTARSTQSEFQKAELSRPLVSIAGDEPTGKSDDELPASMYNYCMQRLAASPDPWHDPALLWWLLLFAIQFCTMACFGIYNDLTLNEIGVAPPEHRDPSASRCIFASSAIAGTPLMQYCMGYVAIVLVAMVIRNDDENNFQASYPQKGAIVAMKYVINLAWFWQTVYMPGCFALETATLFASSPDSMEVVMNTLAVTFITEIDNMLYDNLLSKEAKETYQQRMGLNSEEVSPSACCQASWAIFTANIALMLTMYTGLLLQLGSGQYGQAYLMTYWYLTPLLYCFSFVARALLQSSIVEEQTVSGGFLGAISAAFLGVLVYEISAWLSLFKILLLWPFPGPFYQWGYQESDFVTCNDN